MMDAIRKFMMSPMMGNIHAVITTIAYATSHFIAQIVMLSSNDVSMLQIVFVRGSTVLILLLPFLLRHHVDLTVTTDKLPTLLFYCLPFFVNLVANYVAFTLVPLSIVLTISATCPIFTIVFASCVLKERWSWLDVVCSVFSFLGVFLIARPTFIFGKYGAKVNIFQQQHLSSDNYELKYLAGCALATLVAVTKAAGTVVARQWTQISSGEGSKFVLMFYTNITFVLLSSILMILTGKVLVLPTPLYARCALFTIGMYTMFGQFTFISALGLQNASVVSVIRNIDIIYACVLEFIVFGSHPDYWSVAGAILIVLFTSLLFFRERIINTCKRNISDSEAP